MDQKNKEKEFRFKELIKLSNRIVEYTPFSDFTHSGVDIKNDICGDLMTIYLKAPSGIIERVGLAGSACTVSRAVMVKTADNLIGKSLDVLDREFLLNSAIELGFNPSSTRAGCAQFPSVVVLKAVNKW